MLRNILREDVARANGPGNGPKDRRRDGGGHGRNGHASTNRHPGESRGHGRATGAAAEPISAQGAPG